MIEDENLLGEDGNKKFVCKFCTKEFNDGRKLGGHISRVHPSHRYRQK